MGRGGGGLLGGLGLGGCLVVQEAGEAGAHGDEVVQDLAVAVRVCGVLAGGVWWRDGGWLGGHERNKNIVGGSRSRVTWVGC